VCVHGWEVGVATDCASGAFVVILVGESDGDSVRRTEGPIDGIFRRVGVSVGAARDGAGVMIAVGEVVICDGDCVCGSTEFTEGACVGDWVGQSVHALQ